MIEEMESSTCLRCSYVSKFAVKECRKCNRSLGGSKDIHMYDFFIELIFSYDSLKSITDNPRVSIVEFIRVLCSPNASVMKNVKMFEMKTYFTDLARVIPDFICFVEKMIWKQRANYEHLKALHVRNEYVPDYEQAAGLVTEKLKTIGGMLTMNGTRDVLEGFEGLFDRRAFIFLAALGGCWRLIDYVPWNSEFMFLMRNIDAISGINLMRSIFFVCEREPSYVDMNVELYSFLGLFLKEECRSSLMGLVAGEYGLVDMKILFAMGKIFWAMQSGKGTDYVIPCIRKNAEFALKTYELEDAFKIYMNKTGIRELAIWIYDLRREYNEKKFDDWMNAVTNCSNLEVYKHWLRNIEEMFMIKMSNMFDLLVPKIQKCMGMKFRGEMNMGALLVVIKNLKRPLKMKRRKKLNN